MSRDGKILIYGATGYTGKLMARAAKAQGLSPVLAGRSPAKVQQIAGELDLPWTAFDLSETGKLEAALSEAAVVVHAAGPFSATSKPMVDA